MISPAQLDAMEPEEAWDKCVYTAWTQRQLERVRLFREAQLETWRAETKASVERFWAALTPEERADFEARSKT